MKIRIEILGEASEPESEFEDEVIIRCRKITKSIEKIQRYISDIASLNPDTGERGIAAYKDKAEFYLLFSQILFFETGKDIVYAHTADDAYPVKFRLYELEQTLPRFFIRVSKGTIINIQHILSITRNLASASPVKFHKTHKQVYVSRSYYAGLKKRLEERKLFL
jgi:DNA-binding LytR/AlgR family response regulator